MQDMSKLTAAKAKAEIEKREREREEVRARIGEIAPGLEWQEVAGRQLTKAYTFPRGPEYQAALDGDDPEEVIALEREFERLVARLKQLDAQLKSLGERLEEVEVEERVAAAPKTVAKASELLEQSGPKIRQLEGEIQELRNTMKQAANDVLDVRKLVGDGAPGMTPEALHELWRQKYADADGRVRPRGDSGAIRVLLFEDVRRFLEPPTEEVEKLTDEWERTVGSHRRGTQMGPIDRKDRARRFLRDLQEARVVAIAKGHFE